MVGVTLLNRNRQLQHPRALPSNNSVTKTVFPSGNISAS
jgi:hypothetical protein